LRAAKIRQFALAGKRTIQINKESFISYFWVSNTI